MPGQSFGQRDSKTARHSRHVIFEAAPETRRKRFDILKLGRQTTKIGTRMRQIWRIGVGSLGRCSRRSEMVMLQAIQRTVRTKNERESPLSQVPMVVFSSLVHFIYGLYLVAHNNLTNSCNPGHTFSPFIPLLIEIARLVSSLVSSRTQAALLKRTPPSFNPWNSLFLVHFQCYSKCLVSTSLLLAISCLLFCILLPLARVRAAVRGRVCIAKTSARSRTQMVHMIPS